MEPPNANSTLACVLFPAIVKDDEKALQCLGGIKNISQVYSQPNSKRLGVSFHPNNPFVKKVFADVKNKSGVLFKVKVKRTSSNNVQNTEIVSTTVVGRVNKIFKFESLCDFQYMPVEIQESDKSPKCILEKIIPSSIESLDYLQEPCPQFLVPPFFSRFEKSTEYSYTDRRCIEKAESSDYKKDHVDNVLKKNRAARSLPTKSVVFNMIDDLPTKPNQYFVDVKNEKVKCYPNLQTEYDTVKKMFEERPIWSTNLIRYITKFRLVSLKIILPCLALRMIKGPWKLLWIRFGYDPRKDPEARKYQSVDFRVRLSGGFKEIVTIRSSVNYNKSSDQLKQPQSEEIQEGSVYYRPGMIPSQRQIFYQYCDVKLPEVEEIISREPAAGATCHPSRGWLPPDTQELCREYVCQSITRTLHDNNRTDVSFEQASSEDSNSEGEGENIKNELNEPTTSKA